MDVPKVEVFKLMFRDFKIDDCKRFLNMIKKPITGSEKEVRFTAKKLIWELESNACFENVFTSIHFDIRQRDFVRVVDFQLEPELPYITETVKNNLADLLSKPKLSVILTIELIKKRFQENEILEEVGVKPSIKVSLLCPLSRKRIHIPCRGENCQHLQCFDGEMFFGVKEKVLRRNMKCPVCNSDIDEKKIVVDKYFSVILDTTPDDEIIVEIYEDCGWQTVVTHAEELPQHGSDEEVMLVDEIHKPKPSTPRKTNRPPATDPEVAPEDMLVVVEIND